MTISGQENTDDLSAIIERAHVTDGAPAMFIARVKDVGILHADRIKSVWETAWIAAGYERAPGLLIVDSDFEITAASDATLESVGLMRIPAKA
jgi:hypothetical protein